MDYEEDKVPDRIEDLRGDLAEAGETFHAGRSGQIDTLVASGPLVDQAHVVKGLEDPCRWMLESMNQGAVILDDDGTIVYSNCSFAAMLDLPLDEVIGAQLNSFLVPDDLQSYAALIQNAHEGIKGEVRFKTNRGSVLPVDLSLGLFELGASRNLCGVITDLTEEKRHQELLALNVQDRAARFSAEAARERIANILESITDAFFAVNREWRITYMNQTAASIMGKPREELIGLVLWDLTLPGTEVVRNEYEKAMEGRLAVHFEAPAAIASVLNRDRWFERHLYPMEEGLAVYLRDVTERKKVEEALQQTRAELMHVSRLATMGEVAASLARELNQSLGAIVANGDACLRWLGRSEPNLDGATDGIQRVIGDAKRAGEVIAHTRALFTKSVGERTAVDMADIIREILVLARPEMERQRIVLHDHLAEGLSKVSGVRAQLQQAVLNLVINAVEAMADLSEQRRHLIIRSRRYGYDKRVGLLVTVQDAGVGVAEENLNRIFEPFYTTKARGLGLGLSISRSIIESHSGRLWAIRNPDYGITFQFLVPGVEL
jgi:PAS domain S-box-containing protein